MRQSKGTAAANKQPDFILGLDLGQTSDFSAMVIVQRTWKPTADKQGEEPHHSVRFMKRWQLKTSYPAIVADVVKMVRAKPLVTPPLIVDSTGVGRAVVDLFKETALRASGGILTPVLITAGSASTWTDGSWHVPKKELVGAVQVALQTRRLHFAPFPGRDLLAKEMQNFKVKISSAGNEQFEAWRERDHDDMVLAVALAVWHGERTPAKQTCWRPAIVGLR